MFFRTGEAWRKIWRWTCKQKVRGLQACRILNAMSVANLQERANPSNHRNLLCRIHLSHSLQCIRTSLLASFFPHFARRWLWRRTTYFWERTKPPASVSSANLSKCNGGDDQRVLKLSTASLKVFFQLKSAAVHGAQGSPNWFIYAAFKFWQRRDHIFETISFIHGFLLPWQVRPCPLSGSTQKVTKVHVRRSNLISLYPNLPSIGTRFTFSSLGPLMFLLFSFVLIRSHFMYNAFCLMNECAFWLQQCLNFFQCCLW